MDNGNKGIVNFKSFNGWFFGESFIMVGAIRIVWIIYIDPCTWMGSILSFTFARLWDWQCLKYIISRYFMRNKWRIMTIWCLVVTDTNTQMLTLNCVFIICLSILVKLHVVTLQFTVYWQCKKELITFTSECFPAPTIPKKKKKTSFSASFITCCSKFWF